MERSFVDANVQYRQRKTSNLPGKPSLPYVADLSREYS